MSFFVYRLLPPRPSFAFDMSEAERGVMSRHGEYWRGHAASGTALIFGPVGDPAGPWGLGIIEVDDAAQAQKLADADPAVSTRTCDVEILPMLEAFLRADIAVAE